MQQTHVIGLPQAHAVSLCELGKKKKKDLLCVNKAPHQGWGSKTWAGFHPLPHHHAGNNTRDHPGKPCLPSTTLAPSSELGTEMCR